VPRQPSINTQWNLHFMANNIYKLAKSGYAQWGQGRPGAPRQALWRGFAAHLAQDDETFNRKTKLLQHNAWCSWKLWFFTASL
jgi:hypothetical protein